MGFFLAPVFLQFGTRAIPISRETLAIFGVCEKENISYPALLCIQMAMSIENEFVDQASS